MGVIKRRGNVDHSPYITQIYSQSAGEYRPHIVSPSKVEETWHKDLSTEQLIEKVSKSFPVHHPNDDDMVEVDRKYAQKIKSRLSSSEDLEERNEILSEARKNKMGAFLPGIYKYVPFLSNFRDIAIAVPAAGLLTGAAFWEPFLAAPLCLYVAGGTTWVLRRDRREFREAQALDHRNSVGAWTHRPTEVPFEILDADHSEVMRWYQLKSEARRISHEIEAGRKIKSSLEVDSANRKSVSERLEYLEDAYTEVRGQQAEILLQSKEIHGFTQQESKRVEIEESADEWLWRNEGS